MNSTTDLFLLLSASLNLISTSTLRQTRLLPLDASIIHCAGQTNQNFNDNSIISFDKYSNYLTQTTKPQAFMANLDINTLKSDEIISWFNELNFVLSNYSEDTFHTIQMGLNFNDCLMAQPGKFDTKIMAIINGFKTIQRPVYLRIGTEVNAIWNGYTPKCYIKAFQRITNFLRNDTFCNNYVATVWDYTAEDNTVDYMEFYPGDKFVDWWGIRIFGCYETDNCVNSFSGINSPRIKEFLLHAVKKSFPVMITESSNVGYDTMPNSCLYPNSWNIWYKPYFEMILSGEYSIKGFCYINWNYWQWGKYNWNMSEITECNEVGLKYKEFMSKNKHKFANAMNERDTKELLGLE